LNGNEIIKLIEQAIFNANMTTITNIMNNLDQDYGIADLRDKLNTLPDDMYHHRKQINSYRSQLRNLHKEIKDKEAEIKSLENNMLLIITNETDPNTGKAVFSNEKARQAELANRKKTDPEYITLENQVRELRNQADELENQIAVAEADLEKLQNVFSAVLKQTSLACREMDLAVAAMSAGSRAQQLHVADSGAGAKHSEAEIAEGWDA